MACVLLVMPDAFHLGWMGTTRRLFHLADAFRELGFNVVLLAGKMTNAQLQAKIDRQFPGLVLRTHHTGAYPCLLDIAPLPRRAWRAFWKARGSEYYAARLSYGWASVLNVGQVIKEVEQRGFRPDLIWGISAGYLEGGVAADRLAKALGVPWIFELQDPPRGCGLGPDRATIYKEFTRLLRSAAQVVVTTESYRNKLLKDFALIPEAIRTIHLTYEGGLIEGASCHHSGRWRLVYTGSLQGGRSLAPLLHGLGEALVREPRMHGSISMEIAGTGSGLDETRKLSERLGVKESVRFYGYVDREQAEELHRQANVLIVVQTVDTSKLQVPGKIFEYMRMSRPILAIMPECEAADILRRSGLGLIHHPEDIDGIADTLIKLWSDWRTGRSSVRMDYDYVTQFSVKNLPEKLRPVLEGLV